MRNDLRFRCENLQSALVNLEEMKQLDRSRQAEALANKDAAIADLTKKLQYAEKQMQVREKTDLLMAIRTSS